MFCNVLLKCQPCSFRLHTSVIRDPTEPIVLLLGRDSDIPFKLRDRFTEHSGRRFVFNRQAGFHVTVHTAFPMDCPFVPRQPLVQAARTPDRRRKELGEHKVARSATITGIMQQGAPRADHTLRIAPMVLSCTLTSRILSSSGILPVWRFVFGWAEGREVWAGMSSALAICRSEPSSATTYERGCGFCS